LVLLGALAIGLSLLTGFVYRQLILEDQRAYLGELLAVEVPPSLDGLTAKAVEMGISVHREEVFHAALEAPAAETAYASLKALLDEQFHQYYVRSIRSPCVRRRMRAGPSATKWRACARPRPCASMRGDRCGWWRNPSVDYDRGPISSTSSTPPRH